MKLFIKQLSDYLGNSERVYDHGTDGRGAR